MDNLKTFKVHPAIPESLDFLRILASNLWWCWRYEAIELFKRIDPELWDKNGRNPITFLAEIPQERYNDLLTDESFLGHLEQVKEKYRERVETSSEDNLIQIDEGNTIAYLSMEFGIHESIPIFAGGLGVLAGDHLKAASRLGLPLTGIGLLFNQGYFRQHLDHNGWQQDSYPSIEVYNLPFEKVLNKNGKDIIIEIPSPNGLIKAVVYQLKVGRIRLLLLDTDLPDNSAFAKRVTNRLYDSESEIRIAQEALLGIGGMKALKAIGLFPKVLHMNEGHCSFAGLERLSMIMDKYNVDVNTGLQILKRTSLFTTHTPVMAGHDEFFTNLVFPYVKPYTEKFGMSVESILLWGQSEREIFERKLSMFILGSNFAGHINGVSQLHGDVARKMWKSLWIKKPIDEIPISYVTNGVHTLSYISHQNSSLFERQIAIDWDKRLSDVKTISKIDHIDNNDIWHAHEIDKGRLIRFARKQVLKQYTQRNAPRNVIDEVSTILDQHALTICFARRFATYKRATLLLSDPERLKKLILSKDRPIQIIFAGKAHPNDTEGKRLIQKIIDFLKQPEIRQRVVFLENYDINVARYMVQGCDVWLNTPRRPNEACGTSGMKAAINGGLNLSILDGWWVEGYKNDRGWAIGNGVDYEDDSYQNMVDSLDLYNILENEVIPAYYERHKGGAPEKWIKMIKETMKMAILEFSSNRMVREYTNRFYVPLSKNLSTLTENNSIFAKDISCRLDKIKTLWNKLWIGYPFMEQTPKSIKVGDEIKVKVKVYLDEVKPEEIEVQLYYGKSVVGNRIMQGEAHIMTLEHCNEDKTCTYSCMFKCKNTGNFAYTGRIIPSGDDVLKNTPGLITWSSK